MCYGLNMGDDVPHPPLPVEYACPHCGQPVELAPPPAPAPAGQAITCPYCFEEFSIAGAPPYPAEDADDAQWERRRQEKEQELDSLRIRNVVVARRAAFRTRSYFLIAGLGAAAITAQLLVNAFYHFKNHTGVAKPYGYLLCAAALVVAIIFCMKHARRLSREMKHSALDELPPPKNEPDFSQLSDGSQQVRNLEDIK